MKTLKQIEKVGKRVENTKSKKLILLNFLQTNKENVFNMNELKNKYVVDENKKQIFKSTQHINNTLNTLIKQGLVDVRNVTEKDISGKIRDIHYYYYKQD